MIEERIGKPVFPGIDDSLVEWVRGHRWFGVQVLRRNWEMTHREGYDVVMILADAGILEREEGALYRVVDPVARTAQEWWERAQG